MYATEERSDTNMAERRSAPEGPEGAVGADELLRLRSAGTAEADAGVGRGAVRG